MAVDKLVGPPRKFAKFVSLVVAMLMAGATLANILYTKYALAVATAIIGAWALLVFTDMLRAEFAQAARFGDAPSNEQDD